jgi:hypothetical protein
MSCQIGAADIGEAHSIVELLSSVSGVISSSYMFFDIELLRNQIGP